VNKDLSLKPKDMKKLESFGDHGQNDAWFYEEPGGFLIVMDGVGQYLIPWRTIRAALTRKDKK